MGTRGQQDDPRLSSILSNANCAKQPNRKGTTETNAGRPTTGQVTETANRGVMIFNPIVKKADVKYPLRPVMRPHLFALNCI